MTKLEEMKARAAALSAKIGAKVVATLSGVSIVASREVAGTDAKSGVDALKRLYAEVEAEGFTITHAARPFVKPRQAVTYIEVTAVYGPRCKYTSTEGRCRKPAKRLMVGSTFMSDYCTIHFDAYTRPKAERPEHGDHRWPDGTLVRDSPVHEHKWVTYDTKTVTISRCACGEEREEPSA